MDKNLNTHDAQPGEVAASLYLTRKQTAAYLNVSEKWLAQSGRAVGPRFHKFGSQCRYLRSDVVSWARQQRATR
ncbi:helix-turn-helix domain-containing protein [Pseudarthrobacter equi]|uniref:helix-turn-helix domain-containing protein n=1 Tax=Pseudarthrobacter equi TaxID=728066 RepID=UPI000B839D2E|nr:helix-turn-helix domain-containing protein [Pseudarthrobacter equi]